MKLLSVADEYSISRKSKILRARVSGDYGLKVTPVPIPNTKVKLQSANGTAGEARWESRSLPDKYMAG